MPNYEFECQACGTFEQWRDHRRSSDPAMCPQCGSGARRSYSAPLVRSPSNAFASVNRDLRARYERSRTGEPSVTQGSPGGREVHPNHSHGPTRPWQIGH